MAAHRPEGWLGWHGGAEVKSLTRVPVGEAIARKYPEWVAFVVACDAKGKPNLMPAGWVMFASGEPPMLAVAIAHSRYTHQLIEQTGEYVIAFAGQGQEELIRRAGSSSGRDVDKFAQFQIETAPGEMIRCPLLVGAAINFECRIEQRAPAGDHSIFIGRILAAHVPDPPIPKLENFGQERYLVAAPRE